MDRQKIKDSLEAVGIIAVVASLIFVGLQLRQTEESIRMQFLQGETLSFQEWIGRASESAELAEALVISRDSPSDLTPAQRQQVRAWLEEWLGQIATWGNLHASGVFAETELQVRIENNCYIYKAHKVVLDEIRKELSYGFDIIDKYCGN